YSTRKYYRAVCLYSPWGGKDTARLCFGERTRNDPAEGIRRALIGVEVLPDILPRNWLRIFILSGGWGSWLVWDNLVVITSRVDEQFCSDRKSTRLNSSHVSISYAAL